MEIHNFNPVSRRHIPSVGGKPILADVDQLDPDRFLMPANATTVPVPSLRPNEAALINATLDEWDVVSDYVGCEYWLSDGSHHTISELGISPPAEALNAAPFMVDNAKRAAITRIKIDCDSAMRAGVESNALGGNHIYPTKERDQGNMQAVVIRAQVHGITGEPYKFWCADAADMWARRDHTAAEIMVAGDAVFAHVSSCQDTWERKLAEIDAVADLPSPTQANFDAVIWGLDE